MAKLLNSLKKLIKLNTLKLCFIRMNTTLVLRQLKIARQFFIITAIYGLFLRLYKVVDFIPLAYKNILQAHSHVTFLGWGFLAVITLIGFVYYPNKLEKSTYLKRLFNLMNFTLFGMLLSFPLQGYKVFSIVFLSVFGIAAYFYLAAMLKELKAHKSYSAKFIKTGIFYYFLSSIAIWAIAIITIKLGKTTLYYNSIYFYLHFLYNGFFVFSLFGLWIYYLEKHSIYSNKKSIQFFYRLTHWACIPAYALSLLWTEVSYVTYFFAFLAGILQLGSLYYLYPIYKSFFNTLQYKQIKMLGILVFGSYFLKIILQFSTVFPVIIKKAVQLKPFFIVGYLHLFTIGFMSLFLFLLSFLLPKIKIHKNGLKLFITGFVLTEVLLFTNGLKIVFFQQVINEVDWLLLFVTIFMPIGLLMIYFKPVKN